jgi:hypothetical protein
MSGMIWQVFARIPDVGVTSVAARKESFQATQNLAGEKPTFHY